MVELYIFFHDTLSNKIIKQMLDILELYVDICSINIDSLQDLATFNHSLLPNDPTSTDVEKPMVANMAIRPCFNSTERLRFHKKVGKQLGKFTAQMVDLISNMWMILDAS